ELISFCVGLKLKGFKRMADRSRMNREVHVRFCGGLEVRFLRSTRLTDPELVISKLNHNYSFPFAIKSPENLSKALGALNN
ncbi:MAG: hypothetical protein JSV38_02735, partial [Desulfobacterales bacterium]